MKVCLHLSFLVLLQAKQEIVIGEAVQSSVGVALLLLTTLIYFFANRSPRQVVQFQHFELTHAPTPVPVLKDGKQDQSTSHPSSTLQEMSFQSDGASPTEPKKRKRKAHRLSDRRRNNQSQECEQVEQGSDL